MAENTLAIAVKNNQGLIQFFKFGIVGAANTAVDWVVFYILVNTVFDINHSFAKAISFIVAVLNSYFWNTIWTFRKEYRAVSGKNGAKSAIFIKFIAVSVIGWGINVIVYSLTAKDLHLELLNKDLLPLVLASGAAILWNFFANKFWTYK